MNNKLSSFLAQINLIAADFGLSVVLNIPLLSRTAAVFNELITLNRQLSLGTYITQPGESNNHYSLIHYEYT